MIGSLTTNNMYMLETSLDYLWTKQAVIADNVANAETPNYKAKYVQFEDTFQARLVNASQSGMKSWEIQETIKNSNPYIYTATTETFKSDSNGVDVAEQEMEAYRNNMQMQYVISAITSEYTLLRAVINAQ